MRNVTLMSLAALALVLGGCDDGEGDVDGGPTPGVDSGPTDIDAGPDDEDGGPGDMDAGLTDSDGGAHGDGGQEADGGTTADGGGATCGVGVLTVEETACSPAFAACGGTLVGDWCYSNLCVTKAELLAPLLDSDLVGADCDADDITIVSSSGTVEGTLSFTASTVTRQVDTSAMGNILAGTDCIDDTDCGLSGLLLNGALTSEGIGTASCTDRTDSMPGCDCNVTITSSATMTGDAYTVEGGDTITLTSSGRTFEYCVDGGDLHFRETTDGGEPGTQTASAYTRDGRAPFRRGRSWLCAPA